MEFSLYGIVFGIRILSIANIVQYSVFSDFWRPNDICYLYPVKKGNLHTLFQTMSYLANNVSNTTGALILVYSNTFIQKKCVSPSCKEFYIHLWSFVKFGLQNMSSKIKQAFEKNKKNVFCLHFANFNFNVIFPHFLINFFLLLNISYLKFSINLCEEYHFLYINNCHKSC